MSVIYRPSEITDSSLEGTPLSARSSGKTAELDIYDENEDPLPLEIPANRLNKGLMKGPPTATVA